MRAPWAAVNATITLCPRNGAQGPILQRKALTPADFATQATVAARILGFPDHYERVAKPFAWQFTRRDLHRLMARWRRTAPASLMAAA